MSDIDSTVIKPRPGHAATANNDQTIIKPRPAGDTVNADQTVISPRRKLSNTVADDDRTQLLQRSPKRPGIAINAFNATYDLPSSPALIRDASPLLSIISQLKQLDGSMKVASIHSHIVRLMQTFMSTAQKHYDDKQLVNRASYALCATIDEGVLNTAWGEHSAWSQKPLLSIFHKETYGGEKFYTILNEELHSDTKHYDLIELLYLCLSLGFLGKLRIDNNGKVKSETIRANAYQTLSKNRDRYSTMLSTNVQPIDSHKRRLTGFLPIWLMALSLTLVAFWLYNDWSLDINKTSDDVTGDLVALIPIEVEPSLPNEQIRKEILLLRQLLAQEIERDVLSVDDYLNKSTIVLKSNALFPSGSADINPAFEPILDKIAKALESIPGRIIVSGHTDSSAIRTVRFPSNWHLSLARASAVGQNMSRSADLKARLLPEGRGDSEPLADNSTAEGRAKNRRVTIELFYNDYISSSGSTL